MVNPLPSSLVAGSTLKNDRLTFFGWTMHNWAYPAYSTKIAGAAAEEN